MSVRPVSPVRLIDPRGHRFGAALSAVILGLALVAGAQLLVVAIALALGTSALFGTRYSVLGRPWPWVRRFLVLGPAEPESEYPPRFAQALGSLGLLLGLALFAAGFATLGWVPVLGVAALQTLLAVTGYCVGCRLYFLRWWLPSLFDRIARRMTIGT
jgi:hypothetical protein